MDNVTIINLELTKEYIIFNTSVYSTSEKKIIHKERVEYKKLEKKLGKKEVFYKNITKNFEIKYDKFLENNYIYKKKAKIRNAIKEIKKENIKNFEREKIGEKEFYSFELKGLRVIYEVKNSKINDFKNSNKIIISDLNNEKEFILSFDFENDQVVQNEIKKFLLKESKDRVKFSIKGRIE